MALKRITACMLTLLFVFTIGSSAIKVFAEGTETKNLVSRLSYEIATGEPTTYSYMNYEPNTYNINVGQLTDGVTAMTDYSSKAWYCSMRGVSRIVTFDLGDLKAVSSFSAGFLHIKSMAIYAPRYVNVLLSEDGATYQTVCKTVPDFDISDSTTRRADITAVFDNTYKARYVKVEFCSDIFTYCDEISVFGIDTLSGTEKNVKADAIVKEPGYLTSIDGVSDMIKIYNGYYTDQDIADNAAEELLPYIAYVQPDGSYTDTMFDSLAFVPCHIDYPSGGRLVKTNNKTGAVMSDWLLYLENTFAESINVNALNDVVGNVYDTLGKKGKFTVYFTLPFPTVLEGAFGDINGDGVEENCSTLEERKAILKWYINLTYDTFLKGKYNKLNFGGFYWYREEVNYSETDHEAELVTETATYLSMRGFKYLYDPFYLSTGFDQWKDLGFDGAVMQPNLVFKDYFKPEMLSEFATAIKKHHLGVEIEITEPGNISDSTYEKYGLTYENYLYYGLQTGYMNSLHTYYQGAGPGTIYNFCKASATTIKGIYLHSLYDKTYKFIKGTYTANAPTVVIDNFETTAGQKNAKFPMTVTDIDTLPNEISVIFTKEPEHGTVTPLPNNKSIVFTAEEGYSGMDTFEVKVFDKFTYSEPITVTVNIVNTAALNESKTNSNSSATVPDEKGNTILIILISIGIIVACGTIAILYVRSKKK